MNSSISWPTALDVFMLLYIRRGATHAEACKLASTWSKATVQRYQAAWAKFVVHLEESFLPRELGKENIKLWGRASVEEITMYLCEFLEQVPLWKMAIELKDFQENCGTCQCRK